MAQWVRAFDAPTKNPGPFFITHVVAHNITLISGNLISSSGLPIHCTHMVYTHVGNQSFKNWNIHKSNF